jgi:hypothetical protein
MKKPRASHEPIVAPLVEPPPRPGHFYRSEDGATWTPIDPDTLIGRFGGSFVDACVAVDAMYDGQTVRTVGAFYQFSEVQPIDLE